MAQSCVPQLNTPNRRLEEIGPYNPYWTPNKLAQDDARTNLIQDGNPAPSSIQG